eukprot:PhF_6_TR29295/c0_g1_i3/m.42944
MMNSLVLSCLIAIFCSSILICDCVTDDDDDQTQDFLKPNISKIVYDRSKLSSTAHTPIPLFRHLGFTPNTFYIRKGGFITEDQLYFWGIRAMLVEQHGTGISGAHNVSDWHSTCAYIGIDTKSSINASELYWANTYDP